MATTSAPPPIPGTRIDPPDTGDPAFVERLQQRSTAATVGYRAYERFSAARGGLLAAGTTYYLFLSLFALLAFAYGIVALVGADTIARVLTDALQEALPGLVGEEGIDPDRLRAVGQATSIIGLLVLLLSGSGAMVAASASLHLVYGAPPDPRSLVAKRARLLGWLALLGPLVVLSFAGPSAAASLTAQVQDWLGISAGAAVATAVAAFAVGFLLDLLIVYLLLGVLGGIRPARRPRLVGAAVAALLIGVVKYLLSFIIGWSVDRPQYGAFAVPITVLFVLFLLTIVVYASASLTAALAERE